MGSLAYTVNDFATDEEMIKKKKNSYQEEDEETEAGAGAIGKNYTLGW